MRSVAAALLGGPNRGAPLGCHGRQSAKFVEIGVNREGSSSYWRCALSRRTRVDFPGYERVARIGHEWSRRVDLLWRGTRCPRCGAAGLGVASASEENVLSRTRRATGDTPFTLRAPFA